MRENFLIKVRLLSPLCHPSRSWRPPTADRRASFDAFPSTDQRPIFTCTQQLKDADRLSTDLKMLQSPAKKRKVSPFRSVPAKVSDANPISQQEPTTPTRASYASPTKASLARSHPNILARSPGRRSGGLKRGRNLRDEILAGKGDNEERPVDAGDPLPDTLAEDAAVILNPQDGTTNERNEKRDNFTNMMAKAFAVPRSPLTTRQGPAARHALFDGARELSEDDLPRPKEPKLVPKPTLSASQPRGRQDPSELPPPLVQFGMQPVPHKPRGLASSSSPRHSKHGSSSGRNRVRRRGDKSTSSPLKPKATALVETRQSSPEASGSEREIFVEEALESDAEQEPEMTPAELEEVKEKQSTLAELQEQLSHLQADINKLEESTNSSNDSAPVDPALLELLTDKGASEIVLPPPNQLGDTANEKFLKLFAPADLQLTSVTWTRKLQRQIHTVHQIRLLAPTHLSFGADFTVIINPETFAIQSITFENVQTRMHYRDLPLRARHPALEKWIEDRLKPDSFHRFDLGSIICGMGEYYIEAGKREKVFRDLTRRLLELAEARHATSVIPGELNRLQHAQKMSGALSRIRFEVDLDELFSQELPRTTRRRQKKHVVEGRKLLLTWSIDLDWTGTPRPTIDLVTSGLPAKADKNVKEAFGMLVKKAGVVEAMERVVTLLGHGMPAADEAGKIVETDKKGKAKEV